MPDEKGDLVDGLRNMGLNVCNEAADEIERLRGDLSESKIEVANLDMRLRHRVAEVNHLEGEVERLRARLAEARELIEYAYDEMGGKWPAADAFLAGEKHE